MNLFPVLLMAVLLIACNGKPADERNTPVADSSNTASTHSATSAAPEDTRDVAGQTVFYLLDSMTTMSQSIEKEQERETFDLLPSAILEKGIATILKSRVVRDTVLFHEACTDEDIHYRVHENGLEVMTRTDDPMTLMAPGRSLEMFGVAKGDTPEAVMAKLGSPRKLNDRIALYVTDQPDGKVREFMPNRWRNFILFSNGGVDRIVMQRFQQDC